MIYRKPGYINLKDQAVDLLQKIDKDKASINVLNAKDQKRLKKIKDDEALLKQLGMELARAKMKSNFFIGLFMIIFMSFLSDWFQGVVVAKLPFTPMSFMRGITHRNLVGSDYTDCSMIFLYILSNLCLRPIIQKIMGFDGPRGLQQNSMFPGTKIYKN